MVFISHSLRANLNLFNFLRQLIFNFQTLRPHDIIIGRKTGKPLQSCKFLSQLNSATLKHSTGLTVNCDTCIDQRKKNGQHA